MQFVVQNIMQYDLQMLVQKSVQSFVQNKGTEAETFADTVQ